MKTNHKEYEHLFVDDYAPLETTIDRGAEDWQIRYAQLHSWACVLVNAIRINYEELQESLKRNAPLRGGAPSQYAMAEMITRQIDHKLDEVNAAHKQLDAAISKACR